MCNRLIHIYGHVESVYIIITRAVTANLEIFENINVLGECKISWA